MLLVLYKAKVDRHIYVRTCRCLDTYIHTMGFLYMSYTTSGKKNVTFARPHNNTCRQPQIFQVGMH